MVLFHNVNIGQKVGVNLGWSEIKGTVCYKGALSGKPGDWVGVHLEEKGTIIFKVVSVLSVLFFHAYLTHSSLTKSC